MSLKWFPEEVTQCQIVCALRFDGYRYLESLNQGRPPESQLQFIDLNQSVVDRLELHADQNHNFATFFALQRFLFKWGGERLTKYSADHVAFDFLFLSLYRLQPPEEFIDRGYEEEWKRNILPDVEKHAAFVRRSFRRKGRGPEVL